MHSTIDTDPLGVFFSVSYTCCSLCCNIMSIYSCCMYQLTYVNRDVCTNARAETIWPFVILHIATSNIAILGYNFM